MAYKKYSNQQWVLFLRRSPEVGVTEVLFDNLSIRKLFDLAKVHARFFKSRPHLTDVTAAKHRRHLSNIPAIIHQYFDNFEKLGKWRNGWNCLSNHHPEAKSINPREIDTERNSKHENQSKRAYYHHDWCYHWHAVYICKAQIGISAVLIPKHLISRSTPTLVANQRADSRFDPSQWKTSLQSNVVSHWLGANLESALQS